MKVKSQNFTKAQVTKKKISHTILTRDRNGAKEITKALILQLNEIFQKTENQISKFLTYNKNIIKPTTPREH